MKKSIIAAGVFALLASTGANAADIVTYQEQPVVAPTGVNWNGLYAGGTIGGSWASSSTKLKLDGQKLVRKEVDPNSFIGGIYAGYNFQPGFLSSTPFIKDVVFGIETDFLFNSNDDSGKKRFGHGEGLGEDQLYRAKVKQKWNGSTRLRAGYALGAESRFLPYFAAGVSYADVRVRGDLNESTRFSKSKSLAGWNVGAGIDYVPPIMNDHLVLRAEYRYTDFGSESYGRRTIGTETVKQKADFDQNDFRVGVAYKF